MGAGVLQLAGLEEVLHGRDTVGTHHCFTLLINDGLAPDACMDGVLDHDYFALITDDSPLLRRSSE